MDNYSMDIFVERIIKRKFGAVDALVILGVVVAGLIVLSLPLFIPQLFMFLIVLVAIVCFGAYYLIGMRLWEFEYSITNGDMTCDKIIQRRRRKRQFNIDLHDVDAMGKYDPQKFQGRQFAHTYFVGENAKGGAGEWYMTGTFEKYGSMLVVFSPDARILKAIQPALKRTVANEAFPREFKRVKPGD